MRKIPKQILYIGFGVQICLGLLWMVLNVGGSPLAGESLFGVEVSVPAAAFARILQTVLAAYAASVFLKLLGLTKNKENLFGTLTLVTFPMAMQCHMSLNAYSLLSSLELLQMGLLVKLVWRKKVTGDSEQDRDKRKNRIEKWLFCGLTILLVWLGVTVEKKELGVNDQVGINSVMVSRVAWTSLEDAYPSWPQEWQEALPIWKVREAGFYGDNINRVLLPYMEKVYGTDATGRKTIQGILKQMAEMALERNTRGIAKEIIWDAAGYAISPVVLQLQLKGWGYDSCSGINYANFLLRTPVLSSYYMTFGCRWFGTAAFLAVLLLLSKRKKVKYPMFLTIACGSVLVLLYTMRGAGLMDYRKTIVIVLFWLGWILQKMKE